LKFSLKKDKDEETLLEREEDVERPAGFSSFPVHWNAKGAPEGTYIAQATLTIGDINTTLESTLTINKQDAQKLAASLQEESDIMGKAMAGVQPAKNWQDAVLILQGNAWQAQASPFLLLLNQKIKDAAQPDPDLRALAKGFLWDSRTDVAMYRASSSLIRGISNPLPFSPFPHSGSPHQRKYPIFGIGRDGEKLALTNDDGIASKNRRSGHERKTAHVDQGSHADRANRSSAGRGYTACHVL